MKRITYNAERITAKNSFSDFAVIRNTSPVILMKLEVSDG